MNKYPLELVAIFGKPLTGWVDVDATAHVDCPLCGASAGFYCEAVTGYKYQRKVHRARLTAYVEKHDRGEIKEQPPKGTR